MAYPLKMATIKKNTGWQGNIFWSEKIMQSSVYTMVLLAKKKFSYVVSLKWKYK